MGPLADRIDGRPVTARRGLVRLSLGSIKDSIVRTALRAIEDYLAEIGSRVDTLETGGVPTTRRINTTAPLQGGGTLAADRTLSIDVFTSSVKGAVPA